MPMSGLALGLASLGNLLHGTSSIAHMVCGIISFSIILALVMKLVMFPRPFLDDMRDPLQASVSGTFPMAVMILSTYVIGLYDLALAIWFIGLMLHVALILYFTKRFILRYDGMKVYASYYIVYVGIVVASCTCPAFGMGAFGELIFWFGFLALIPLTIAITYRYVVHRGWPESTFPLLCIYCAPVSLCIVGYLKTMSHISEPFVMAMYSLSVLLYLFGLAVLVGSLRLRFYPSYAALTFPTVICATATDAVSKLSDFHSLEMLAHIETVIASLVVLYVLVRYVVHLLSPVKG